MDVTDDFDLGQIKVRHKKRLVRPYILSHKCGYIIVPADFIAKVSIFYNDSLVDVLPVLVGKSSEQSNCVSIDLYEITNDLISLARSAWDDVCGLAIGEVCEGAIPPVISGDFRASEFIFPHSHLHFQGVLHIVLLRLY